MIIRPMLAFESLFKNAGHEAAALSSLANI